MAEHRASGADQSRSAIRMRALLDPCSVVEELEAVRTERDRWIRLFNRLDAAVTHHKHATGAFATDADETLYAARERILRDASNPRTDDEPRHD